MFRARSGKITPSSAAGLARFRARPVTIGTIGGGDIKTIAKRWPTATTVAVGIIAGLSSGFLGIGGGVFLVPALVFLIGLPEHEAHATSVTTIVPTTLVSALIYAGNKLVNLNLAWQLAVGGVVGGYIGARLMNRCPPLLLRRAYAVFIAAISLKMLLGS